MNDQVDAVAAALSSVYRVVVEPTAGSGRFAALNDAHRISRLLGRPVHLRFNDQLHVVLADPEQTAAAAARHDDRIAGDAQLVEIGLPAQPAWAHELHDHVDAHHLGYAAGQTMTLGALMDALEAAPPGAAVVYAGAGLTGQVPTGIDSWRGVYADLALDHGPPTRWPITVRELLVVLDAADGATFTGYKGGDYRMSRSTPVWVDNYGESGGPGIAGVSVVDGRVVLQLRVRTDEDGDVPW